MIQDMPDLQTVEVLEMFLSHLTEEKCPDHRLTAAPFSPAAIAADRAFVSLQALGNFCPILLRPGNAPFLALISKAWPGIYKWMQSFYHLNGNPRNGTAEQRRNSMEMIAYALYSITHDDDTQKMISATPGIIELTTLMWKIEDHGTTPPLLEVPMGTSAFHHVLFEATDSMLDEVVRESGGTAENVADLALSRLRAAIKKKPIKPTHIHAYVDIMVSFSRCRGHALRQTLLKKRAMALVTTALLSISTMPLRDESVLSAVISCFGFIRNLIEAGEGIYFVRQVIQEGFLQAFINISPSFGFLDSEAQEFTLSLIDDILPRYLVFRSIIQVVDTAMSRIETPENRAKIQRSPVRKSWADTKALALERLKIKFQSDVMKRQVAYCDYVSEFSPNRPFLLTRTLCMLCSARSKHLEIHLKDVRAVR